MATLRRHAHAKTEVRLVCKDGRWPDHAEFFYNTLGEHFDYKVQTPITKLKVTYFKVVPAKLKKAERPPVVPERGLDPAVTAERADESA